MFDWFKKQVPPKGTKRFPPVPDWQPSIVQPLDRIAERVRYYTNRNRDFALFQHGTCVILANGLSDEQAELSAMDVLHRIFHAHPDMKPIPMDDGNMIVQYSQPAFNVVLRDVVQEHWDEIDARHQQALATDEVLITQLGKNRFDDFGKKALFGRCFMFMDAQDPKVVRIERSGV